LLVQEIAARYPGRVTFVSENFGASQLADKYGVKGYPAVFVGDVLVAVPRDFGYFGEKDKEGTGRYAPWRNAENQAKFKADLTRMIDLILAGKKDAVTRERAGSAAGADPVAALPNFSITDLNGKPLTAGQLSGRVVMVEFWATWCPPCRSTLQWLGELKQKYGDNVAIVALAVDSPEAEIRSTVSTLSPDLSWAITDAATAQSFGDITSVPTMFLFDRSGKVARVLYGAPPDLHQKAEKTLDALVKRAEEPAPLQIRLSRRVLLDLKSCAAQALLPVLAGFSPGSVAPSCAQCQPGCPRPKDAPQDPPPPGAARTAPAPRRASGETPRAAPGNSLPCGAPRRRRR
jgi:thiol-disulfide isomerase/thioredoxin